MCTIQTRPDNSTLCMLAVKKTYASRASTRRLQLLHKSALLCSAPLRFHTPRATHVGGPGVIQPPTTSTHCGKQEPSFNSTSGTSGSHLHLQPTPFSLTGSHSSQYESSWMRFFSSSVVFSRYGGRSSCRAGAFAGQWAIVVCL